MRAKKTITVPFFPVLMAELYRSRQRFPRILVGLVSACLLLGPTFQTFRKWNSFVDYYNDEMILSSLREYVMANVPDRHLEDFVGYNCLTGIYLALDVQPCYSHFSFQRAQTAKSTALRDDVLREFGSKKARVVAQAIEGPVTHYITLSALQLHENGLVVLDEPAAGELKVNSYRYFKAVEEAEGR